MSNDPSNTPQGTLTLSYASVTTVFDIAMLSYDTYSSLGNLTTLLNNHPFVDPIATQLTASASGWTQIKNLAGQTNADDSYQGVAFYKTVNGVTEVVIANRGSQTAHDFFVSDTQLAAGITPASDQDALTYYRNVVSWLNNPANGVSGTTINIIETGHSLGGQEADYVDVRATSQSGISGSLSAVTFNAPGIPRGLTQAGVTYDAVNISLSSDFVHVGGGILNAGYVGNSVLLKAGTPLTPFLAVDIAGIFAADGAGIALEGLGSGGFLYSGLYSNHVGGPMRSYLTDHPALATLDLQKYQPYLLTQDAVDQLSKITPTAYANSTPAQLKALYDSLLVGIPTGQSGAVGGNETFTVTETGTGVTLDGSQGDHIILTAGSNSIEIDDSAGDQTVLTFNADGTALQSDSWTSPNGTKGTDTYRPDGSSSGTITYASGGYVTTLLDGQGNVTTDYFTKGGILYADSWVHSDGTSGTQTLVQNGVTLIPNSPSLYDVPVAQFSLLRNSDGSYVTTTTDATDQIATTSYNADGAIASTSTIQGVGHDFPTDNLRIVSSPDGMNQSAYDADNHLVWTLSQGSDGSYTQVNFHAGGGVTFTKVFHANQTADTYWRCTTNLTHSTFNSNQQLTGDNWSVTDGASGSDTINPNGSLSGTIFHADGTSSTVGLSTSGQLTIENRNSSNVLISQDWWDPDNTHGVTLYNSDGSSKAYLYQTNGLLQETDYAPDGGIVTRQTSLAALVASPDGSQLGSINNSDGTKSINYVDSNGDASIFVMSGGQLQGTQHVGSDSHSDFGVVLPDGTPSTSPYNGYTLVTTSGGTQYVYYTNGSIVTGDNWTAADGTYGSDIVNLDGSRSGASYSTDGSYQDYTDDGHGNLTTTYYAAGGAVIGDLWQFADSSHGGDAYNADGSSSGSIYAANGTYTLFGTDSVGNSAQKEYSAAGVLVADTWADIDGSYGNDTINADGSKSGAAHAANGTYGTYAIDTSGDNLSNYYTATNQLTETVWTLVAAAGAAVKYDFDGSGNLLTRTATNGSGASVTDVVTGGLSGALGGMIVDRQDGDSKTAGASGGVILALGNQDTLTSGGGTTVLDAAGSNAFVTGGSGNDTLTALGAGSTLVGGLGNERFEINDVSDVVQAQAGAAANALFSSVSYTLPVNIEAMTLVGNGNLVATGNSGNDVITGNSGNDTLVAGGGADTLISGSGVDFLEGGRGPDAFIVNNSQDSIDLPWYNDSSKDTIYSSVSYNTDSQISTLTLTGSDNLTATDTYGYATLTGNAGNDTLVGGGGQDTLIAGTGADTLVAGSGTNTLVINNTADVIQATADSRFVTVQSSVSYTLGQYLTRLELIGSADMVGQGNDEVSNYIHGNAGQDTLIAGSGRDTLVAGTGIDTLIAGTGNDVLQGAGGDTFMLNPGFGNDQISLSSGSGIIQFGAGLVPSDLTLGVVVDGIGDASLTISDGQHAVTVDGGLGGSIGRFDFADGSQLSLGGLFAAAHVTDATLPGAHGNFVLDSVAGQSLTGGAGDDTIFGAGAAATIIAGAGNQQIYGLGAGDLLVGGNGNDTLHAGSGDATLVGGQGNTVMYGGSGQDTYELTRGGTATVYAGSTPGVEVIFLPQGMTFADLIGYQDGHDLVLQSATGDVTAVVSGFYGSGTHKTWVLEDATETPKFLANWVGSQHQTPPGSTYRQKIDGLRQAYAARTSATLNDLGSKGGSLTNGSQPIGADPNYFYQFNGVTVQNVSVSGGQLSLAGSEHDNIQTTTVTTQTSHTYTVPVYGTMTIPGGSYFIPNGNSVDLSGDPANTAPIIILPNGGSVVTVYDAAGNPTGTQINQPTQTIPVQTGTSTYTVQVPEQTTITHETQSITAYNVVGDGGDDVIQAPSFVGSVVTGDGNVTVDLGGYYAGGSFGHWTWSGPEPGSFIEAGNGNDSIKGSGGSDTIAAGEGFDTLEGFLGTTFYVPLDGNSTDIIYAPAPFYGNGPWLHDTLVLPDGVGPQDLQVTLYTLPSYRDNNVYSDIEFNPAVLEIRYGNATVLVHMDQGYGPFDPTGQPQHGIDYFQFADGTVLNRDELLALAGPAQTIDNIDPVVTASTSQLTVDALSTVAAAGLFTATDGNGGGDISWYQLSNDAASGAYFVLDGKAYRPGEQIEVTKDQLAQLVYVAGPVGAADTVQAAAWAGVIWGLPTTFNIDVAPGRAEASGPGQTVATGTLGPDTLVGGYTGDILSGSSGQDTFIYNAGSGAEVIHESAEPAATNNSAVQFGAGITSQSLSFSAAASGLMLTLGSGDSVTLAGFDATDPLVSTGIQHFDFADGTSLNMVQLLEQSQASGGTGTFTRADGSSTQYSFAPAGTQEYHAQTTDAAGQVTAQFTLSGNTSTRVITPDDGSGNSSETTHYDTQGRPTDALITNADGSTDQWTYSYNADGSTTEVDVSTPAGGGSTLTTTSKLSSGGQLILEDQYSAAANGSYHDTWLKQDGSHGEYNWDATYSTYYAHWYGSDSSFTSDVYYYNSGGSPTSTNVSFDEYYSSDAGSGDRHYNSSSGATQVDWNSSSTGAISGTTPVSAFVGLQHDDALTSNQFDLAFFNPATSAGFSDFLTQHGGG
jgi:Ca2+-binding RTX toxin-like protein